MNLRSSLNFQLNLPIDTLDSHKYIKNAIK